MSKKKSKLYPVAATLISLALVGALAGGNVACYLNESIITTYLCGFGFSEDNHETIAARESGNALAEDVEEGGAVLLKNNDKTLPLQNKKVNVFGWSGSDDGFMPQGTGSGTGSRNDLVTFLGGLKSAGIEYNTQLAQAYDDLNWKRASGGSFVIEAHGQQYKDFYGITEAPETFYTDALMNNAVAYSDTAIIVLGRLMGEGNDFAKEQYQSEGSRQVGSTDTTRKMQSLSPREEKMIEVVTTYFDNVIVVTNTGNPIELGFADDDKIDAVVNMGMPGTRGAIGLANLLTGKVNFSGRLADTWAYDLSTAAAYATSGFDGIGTYSELGTAYTEYLENIYSGYYWYETADKDGFWDTDFAKQRWGISKGYEHVVQYPFGYGLSYTEFDWEITKNNVENGTITKDGTVELTVKVTNVGDVAGRDVVELYYSAPYTKGGIEKSAIKLGAFAKTAELQPGQHEILTLKMPVEEMKSYDCYDANNNGFMGYELEKGDYTVSLRTDVHTLKEGVGEITLTLEEDVRYEKDSTTGEKVENQFTNYTNETSGATSKVNEPFMPKAHSIDGSDNVGTITYMTRADFVGTFPKERGANKSAGSLKGDVHHVVVPMAEEGAVAPEFDSDKTSWTINDVLGLPYEDTMWDELVSQLTLDTAKLLITKAGFGTIAIPEIGKPATRDTDGPSGFNTNVTGGNNLKAVNYPCDTVIAQTWDWYIAYQVGVAIGIEGNALGINGWYGPGANLHRSALGGRNFEYYSEDALLAGTICAYHVLGAKEKGVLAYIKHIGANEDDKGRNGCYKWLTEQTLRENVLKPFELAIKVGGSNGLMGSVTRTGGMRTTGSYALLTAVVRNEWGFRGTVITDYYQSGDINDIDEGIRVGNSQVLHPDGKISWFDDGSSATALKYIHKSAKDILYSYVATKYYAETAQGLESGSLVGVTTGSEVFAWWKPVVVAIDVFSLLMIGYWLFNAYFPYQAPQEMKGKNGKKTMQGKTVAKKKR